MKTNEDLLRAAIIGYRVQIQEISATIAALEVELRGGPSVLVDAGPENNRKTKKRGRPAVVRNAPIPVAKKKRKMSAASRERIRAAQAKRWAKARAAKESAGEAA